jgi:hypothetical protein
MTGLINSIGRGLSKMGGAIAASAGAAALEAQRESLEQDRLKLADQLSGARESAGRIQEDSLIGARESKGRKETDTYLASSQQRQADFDTAKDARTRQDRLDEIQAQGDESRKTDREQHGLSANDVTNYQVTDDGEVVGFTRGGKSVKTGVNTASMTSADKLLFNSLLASNTTKTKSTNPLEGDTVSETVNTVGLAKALKNSGSPALQKIGSRLDTGPKDSSMPTKPKGSGTKADPFQASSQHEVDWFKNSAPAGTIISVDGTLYTK